MKPSIPLSGCVGDDFARKHGAEIEIFVNGIRQERVLSFDVADGRIIRMKVDTATGNPIVNWQQGRIEQEVIRGRVEVRWK